MTARYEDGLQRVLELAARRRREGGSVRILVGVAGAPGAGKTTLAERLVSDLSSNGIRAVHVPMDGYHLANSTLERLGRRDRKGAVDTFDGWSYVELMRRIAAGGGDPIFAPDFDRTVDDPIAASIEVAAETEVVVSEGNYLLLKERPWSELRTIFTETWLCTVDEDTRMKRLVERHMRFGRDLAAAQAWARDVDGVNARLIGTLGEAPTWTISSTG